MIDNAAISVLVKPEDKHLLLNISWLKLTDCLPV